MNEKNKLQFEVGTSDWSEFLGKTHFTSEVTIFKCTSGYAVITINSQQHTFRAPINFLLKEFALFQVLEVSADFSVTYCRFSMELCNEIYTQLDDRIFEVTEQSVPDIYTEDKLQMIDHLFNCMCLLYNNKHHSCYNKLLINLVLSYTYELYEQTKPFVKKQTVPTNNSNIYILNHFYDLIFDFHTIHHDAKFYADALHISERYLYKVLKETIHITPKQMIDYYLTALIKKTLLTTSLTFQQIADKLNFTDQSAMGQFFKRNTGMTLSEFRNKHI